MKAKIVLGLSLISLLSTSLKAQDTAISFSLVEAQNYAIEHYFESVNAKLDIEKAQKKIWETTAMGLPQAEVSADYQYVMNPPDPISFSALDDTGGFIGNFPVELMPQQNFKYGLTVSQLVFSGEYIVGLQASKVYKTLSEENNEKVEIDLKENIASTYFGILVLEDNLENQLKMQKNLETLYNDTKKSVEVGLMEETNADQLNLTLKNTETAILSISNQVKYMKKLLVIQLGAPAETELELTDDLDIILQSNLVNKDDYQLVLENNIDYKMMDTQEKLMKLDHNRYKTGYLPTVSAFYNYSDQTEATSFSPSVSIVGVSAKWKLFSSGERAAVVSQARIEHEKAVILKEQQSEMIKLGSLQAIDNYDAAFNKYENEKLNLELAEKIFNHTTARFEQGVVSSTDLAQVNNQFIQAQLSYSAALQELFTSKIALDKSHNKL
ncbi:MAG: TolC family protein [Bacteroidales bacterium]|nr:TolC family protein [Bacteroidales bacterium]